MCCSGRFRLASYNQFWLKSGSKGPAKHYKLLLTRLRKNRRSQRSGRLSRSRKQRLLPSVWLELASRRPRPKPRYNTQSDSYMPPFFLIKTVVLLYAVGRTTIAGEVDDLNRLEKPMLQAAGIAVGDKEAEEARREAKELRRKLKEAEEERQEAAELRIKLKEAEQEAGRLRRKLNQTPI